ncbi:DUF934 domain-containing protein [Profundibacter sp.]|uniref:DUF934 domain-containing protein n=1 Tax=Profundibacter sp. TaxID=3101071 RepID=UPI003D10FEF5
MTIIVTDAGFATDNWLSRLSSQEILDIPGDVELADITGKLHRIKAIRITFADFTDGRGLGLARGLRDAGYDGHLRATGDILPDQYTMLRRVGFDGVEITDVQAKTYPQDQWQFRNRWQQHDYQRRLQG